MQMNTRQHLKNVAGEKPGEYKQHAGGHETCGNEYAHYITNVHLWAKDSWEPKTEICTSIRKPCQRIHYPPWVWMKFVRKKFLGLLHLIQCLLLSQLFLLQLFMFR